MYLLKVIHSVTAGFLDGCLPRIVFLSCRISNTTLGRYVNQMVQWVGGSKRDEGRMLITNFTLSLKFKLVQFGENKWEESRRSSIKNKGLLSLRRQEIMAVLIKLRKKHCYPGGP